MFFLCHSREGGNPDFLFLIEDWINLDARVRGHDALSSSGIHLDRELLGAH
jgi:hypothetical protein